MYFEGTQESWVQTESTWVASELCSRPDARCWFLNRERIPCALEELKAHRVWPPARTQSPREGEGSALNITTSVWPHPLHATYNPQTPEVSDWREVLIIPGDGDVQYYTRIDTWRMAVSAFNFRGFSQNHRESGKWNILSRLCISSAPGTFPEPTYKGKMVHYPVWPTMRKGFEVEQTFLPEKAMAPHSSTLAWEIPWMEGHKELNRTERLHFHFSFSCSGERNGNPLQYACLENPRDGSLVGHRIWGCTE